MTSKPQNLITLLLGITLILTATPALAKEIRVARLPGNSGWQDSQERPPKTRANSSNSFFSVLN